MTIADQRSAWVEAATHSMSLEGLEVSDEFRADSEDYVAGKVTSEELVRKARARFGLD
ncbi:hypothetical protein KRR55_17110 [Paeniglutamicibacter sp. ABSL32-1]|uniref:antitoxin VbhA family protein n=1 Tax=Paeniglutamicibacter quisquiliarum TaxID=2849498 RepID=UPI001C2DA097|nr:antitoxin VbhA family protein [Paeniglutamicibacter quisquiliarum]MBV1780836.1 hypothetical protein [Paeniglutamicibacter quisquiliarum]